MNGFDREWTQWKQNSYKEYTNLPAGHYTFRVRFIGPDKKIGEFPAVTIKVLPIWYFSMPAITLYLILFLLIVWALYEQLDLRFSLKQYTLEQII
jgi:hypothetical protein